MYFSNVFGPMKWHIVWCVAVFYLLPALKFVAPDMAINIMLIANAANALVILITGVALTIKEGFKWYYPFIVAFVYAPSLVLYYDVSMTINVVTYCIMSYASLVIGFIISRLFERNR